MRHTIFMAIAIMTFAFTACSSDDDTNKDTDIPKNSFTYDGKTYKLGWLGERKEDNTPAEGDEETEIESEFQQTYLIISEKEPADKIIRNAPHAISIGISASELGKTITLGNEGSEAIVNFKISSTRISTSYFSPEHDIIKATGTIKIEKLADNGETIYSLTFKLNLKNGKTIEGNYSGKAIGYDEYDDLLVPAG